MLIRVIKLVYWVSIKEQQRSCHEQSFSHLGASVLPNFVVRRQCSSAILARVHHLSNFWGEGNPIATKETSQFEQFADIGLRL